MYVGHSINLYNRISSYFMPSILKTKSRRVLRYLNKYAFSNIKLTIYIMDEQSSLEQVVELEQHFIDSLKPNLNVDLVASSSGYHEPMSQEIRDRLRKQRGTPVYFYNADDFTLLYVFESKQHMYNSINIHHTTALPSQPSFIINNKVVGFLARVLKHPQPGITLNNLVESSETIRGIP